MIGCACIELGFEPLAAASKHDHEVFLVIEFSKAEKCDGDRDEPFEGTGKGRAH